ncbi:allantoicase [Folsomia candida]|uniref:allantoicase n=1 Tax=Folsomia candida TaxID=158441 RepID=UPI000B8F26F9|nr:allantoicase [Folsomia candida]
MALRPIVQNSSSLQDRVKFTELNNLSNGAKILFASDDFFANAENLLKEHNAEWKEGVFDPQGKWMDGWETRRKRIPGHDFCIIKLSHPSVIHGFHADTSFFTGNFTPRISIQAGKLTLKEESSIVKRTGESNKAATETELKQVATLGTDKWTVLVPRSDLGAGYMDTCDTFFPVDNRETWTHLRLNYFPDGGVARLRIYGQVKRTYEDIIANGICTKDGNSTLVDLASSEHGGISIGFSNAHYGHPRNMLLTRPIPNIGDGWETARRMDRPDVITETGAGFMESPGQEWAAFRLGVVGKVVKVQVDTTCFKGNFPDSCRVEGCYLSNTEDEQQLVSPEDAPGLGIWKILVPLSKMGPEKTHIFLVDDKIGNKISHVRITIAPDGGVARLRVWGIPSP